MSGPASNNQEDTGYFSDAGIAAISFNPIAFNKLVTPYSTFPLMLVDRRLGAIWLHNMLLSPAAQTKYGALEGTGLNGTLISPVLTWDTKITTVLAVLGGTRNIIAQWLNKTGLLEEFTTRLEGEYKNQFGDIAAPELAWILPSTTISTGRPDFSSCI